MRYPEQIGRFWFAELARQPAPARGKMVIAHGTFLPSKAVGWSVSHSLIQ